MRTLRSLRWSTSGSLAVTTVIVLGVIFGVAAVTVDASRFYLIKRRQQGITDLAALAAATNIGNAQAAAAANLSANGVPAGHLASVELGTYRPDPSVAAAQRFTVGGANPNAARVTLKSTPSAIFVALAGTTSATVATRAVAVNVDVAAFALGSTLANLDGGLANAVLGGLTHTTLNLSVLDYASLANANVDLFGIANALAARIGVTGTYASLEGTIVRVADVVAAAADAGAAANMPAPAVAALRTLANAIGPSGPSIAFGSLVRFGAYGTLAVGSPAPVTASLPLLGLVTAAARLGSGSGEISVVLGSTAFPLASAKIVIGGAAPGSSFAAIGPVGLTLHTAQVRVLLTVQLAASPSLSVLTLPVYVEVAPATATLSAVGCAAGAPADPAATLSVMPGAVDAWIGTVSDAALTNTTAPVSPGPVALTNVQLGLASTTISGLAHWTISNLSATAVPFSRADIAAGSAKSTSTTDLTSSLLSQLIGSLQLTATQTVLGLPVVVAVPTGLTGTIGTLLQGVLQPLDGVLSNTLGGLGITVGDADTWVRAVRCGQGVVVN